MASDSDGGDDVDKLFESSDEEGQAAPAPADEQPAAPDKEGGDDELAGSPAAPGPPRAAPAESPEADSPGGPATAARRFAGEDEDEEEEEAREEDRLQPPQEILGPPLTMEGPLGDGPASCQIRLVRASNILGVETRPFSAETHEFEEEEYEDPVTGDVRVRLNNLIRWRHVTRPDGSVGRESNARFVRWSDGSLQLLLGDEVIDVAEIDVSGDHLYMYMRHQGFIQAQAQLATRMAFRPSSIKSAAHRRLTAAVDKRHGIKGIKVQATTTVLDPAAEKAKREKEEEARIRDREGLAKRQEKEMRKFARPPPMRSSMGGGGLSAAFLEAEDVEEDEEEEDPYLTASERARQALSRPRLDARSEAEAERRLSSAKRGAPPGSGTPAKRQRAAYDLDQADEEMADFIVDEDDEEDAVGARKPAGRRQIALSDDDE